MIPSWRGLCIKYRQAQSCNPNCLIFDTDIMNTYFMWSDSIIMTSLYDQVTHTRQIVMCKYTATTYYIVT